MGRRRDGAGDRRAGMVGVTLLPPHATRRRMKAHLPGVTPARGKDRTLKGIPDLVGPDLRVLFCGINPGQPVGRAGTPLRPGREQILEVAACRGVHRSGPSPVGAGTPSRLWASASRTWSRRTTTAASELASEEFRAGGVEPGSQGQSPAPLLRRRARPRGLSHGLRAARGVQVGEQDESARRRQAVAAPQPERAPGALPVARDDGVSSGASTWPRAAGRGLDGSAGCA